MPDEYPSPFWKFERAGKAVADACRNQDGSERPGPRGQSGNSVEDCLQYECGGGFARNAGKSETNWRYVGNSFQRKRYLCSRHAAAHRARRMPIRGLCLAKKSKREMKAEKILKKERATSQS